MTSPAGFPTRPSRASFGPDPINSRPVRDPAMEFDGEKYGRLMLHQLSGLGVVSAMAWAVLDLLNPTPAILSRAEAWNPNALVNASYPAPVVSRSAAGLYFFEYAASYPDHSGIARTLDLKFAAVCDVSSDANVHHCKAYIIGPRTIGIRTWDSANAAMDGLRVGILVH